MFANTALFENELSPSPFPSPSPSPLPTTFSIVHFGENIIASIVLLHLLVDLGVEKLLE